MRGRGEGEREDVVFSMPIRSCPFVRRSRGSLSRYLLAISSGGFDDRMLPQTLLSYRDSRAVTFDVLTSTFSCVAQAGI